MDSVPIGETTIDDSDTAPEAGVEWDDIFDIVGTMINDDTGECTCERVEVDKSITLQKLKVTFAMYVGKVVNDVFTSDGVELADDTDEKTIEELGLVDGDVITLG